MAVEKGKAWGREVPRPADLVTVDSDADLAGLVANRDHPPVSVTAGDLHRTVGGHRSADTMRCVQVDLLRVELDGVEAVAVAQVLARRSGWLRWWWGSLLAVCNAEHHRDWDLAPRAHPNDGRMDVLEVASAMSARDRWQAWRRLRTGTHLPHPDIGVSRPAQGEWEFAAPMDVWVDGQRHRRIRHLRVTVEPDAFELHI
jgi:hypothetical protein